MGHQGTGVVVAGFKGGSVFLEQSEALFMGQL
jgi:hypothetical protein